MDSETDATEPTDRVEDVESESKGCRSPRRGKKHEGDHPAREILNLLGKAHSIEILYHLAQDEKRVWRFNELEEVLEISPNTLSSRLKELNEAELVKRESYNEIPPRVEYEATQKAMELNPVFRELYEWAKKHWMDQDEVRKDGDL